MADMQVNTKDFALNILKYIVERKTTFCSLEHGGSKRLTSVVRTEGK